MSHAINVYSRLFDPTYYKDIDYYRIFYTTPIHVHALASALASSSATTPQLLDANALVLREVYRYGLVFLADAMEYPSISNKESENPDNISESDDDGDITTMKGTKQAIAAALPPQIAVDMNEDDDIGSMKRAGSVNATTNPNNPNSLFANIDAPLRVEFIVNILAILEVLFQNIVDASAFTTKAKEHFGITITSDLLSKIFDTEAGFTGLLAQLQWYLQTQFSFVESCNHAAINGCVSLLYQVLKTLMKSWKESNSTLVLSILDVDFAPELDKLLIASSTPKLSYKLMFHTRLQVYTLVGILYKLSAMHIKPTNDTDNDNDITTYVLDTSVVHYFNSLKVYNAKDFHNQIVYKVTPLLSMDFKFWYEYSPDLLQAQLSKTLFVSWFSGSVLGGSSSGHDLYNSYNTSVSITSAANNEKEFTVPGIDDEAVLDELQDIYTSRIQRLNLHSRDSEAVLDPEVNSKVILPILLYVQAHFKNPAFLLNLTSHHNHTRSRNTHIELLDILVCLSSYVFFYQHKSTIMKASSKLFIDIYLKLTSNQPISGVGVDQDDEIIIGDRVGKCEINEYKWKLCHHKEPVVPIDTTGANLGFKSTKLYILDTLQVFMRFNMTKKLDVSSFKKVTSIMYQIVGSGEPLVGAEVYQWGALYKTLFGVLMFIKKYKIDAPASQETENREEISEKTKPKEQTQNGQSGSENPEKPKKSDQIENEQTQANEITQAKDHKIQPFKNIEDVEVGILELVEELVTLADAMLLGLQGIKSSSSGDSKPITYELVYNLLLHQEKVKQLLEFAGLQSHQVPRIHECFEYFDREFTTQKSLKASVLDLDYESPEFCNMISGFKVSEPLKEPRYWKYPDTFKYVNSEVPTTKPELQKVVLSTFNSYDLY